MMESEGSGMTKQSRRSVERATSFGAVVYIDTEWDKTRYLLGRSLTSHSFETGMSIVICLNMFFVIHVTNVSASVDSLPTWIHVVSNGLLALYATELVAKLYTFRLQFFNQKSNIMDFIVVMTDCLMLVLEIFLHTLPSASVLRILRLLRLLRAGRIFAEIPELYVMVAGMVSTVRAMICAMVLIAMTLALWSIVAVEFLNPLAAEMQADGSFGDCERCGRAFSSVHDSMLTFFQSTIAGDSWGTLALPMIERQPACALIIIPVMITVNLGLLNLLLIAIVNQANKARDEDAAQRLRDKEKDFEKAKIKLLGLCSQMDIDKNGELSYVEVVQGWDDSEEFANCLRLMDVGRDDLDLIFKYLDVDDSGEVSYLEFVQQLYQLNTKETNTLLVIIKTSLREVHKELKLLKLKVEPIIGKLKDQPRQVAEAIPQAEPELTQETTAESADAKESKPVMEEKSKLQMPSPGLTSDMPQIVGELHRFTQQVDSAVAAALQDIAKKNEEQAAMLQSNSRQLSELGNSLVKLVKGEPSSVQLQPRTWSLPATDGLGADANNDIEDLTFRDVQLPLQPQFPGRQACCTSTGLMCRPAALPSANPA